MRHVLWPTLGNNPRYIDNMFSNSNAKRGNAEGVQAVTMHAKSYAFSPDKITVQIGVPVELRITKSGWVPHTFVIDDPVSGLNVKEKLRSSKPTVIRFTPERKGEFSFFCAKTSPFGKTHREKGMHGIFVVR